tara:strand:- start:49 stop:462 length:414 start_codon:yes stop_codon:yes gene_type:complete
MEVYSFYKEVDFESKLRIIYTIIKLPAMIFHEVCHWFFACILFVRFFKIRCDYFYTVENGVLKSYSFNVITDNINDTKINRAKLMIVNIAPIIGLLILPFFSYWVLIWIAISWKTFIPSKGDFMNFKDNYNVFINNL